MNVHFIAIGGSVMHQLAIALSRKGYQVTGSDDEIFEPARSNLTAQGILPPATGWFPERITPSLDAVILGMHAREDNQELQKAREARLKIYSFPEYIYQESRNKKRVVVGGSHGKTTTTAMIMQVLRGSGRPFDYLVGARLPGFPYAVDITDAPLIVCEGDEYPASALEKQPKFHFLFPHIAIITGIAWDHINVFPTFDIYLEQFRVFIRKIEPGGLLIYNESDPVLNELVIRETGNYRRIPYSVPEHKVQAGVTTVTLEGVSGKLKVFGTHNLLNLNAAWLLCRELGLDARTFLDQIADFTGAAKRLELLAQSDSTSVYRDFAHAPSKVKASLTAVREQFPDRHLVAVLELHTYSSLNADFMSQYGGVLDGADEAAVFYSAHALELKRMPALPPDTVRSGFARSDLAVFTAAADLEAWLQSRNYKNSNLLLMSSGNYDGLDMAAFSGKITNNL